jgi:hypothetical protein
MDSASHSLEMYFILIKSSNMQISSSSKNMPKISLKWMPKQKRARERPKKNWMEGIKKDMNERKLNEGQWEDTKQWSLGVGQRIKSLETDIYVHTFYDI